MNSVKLLIVFLFGYVFNRSGLPLNNACYQQYVLGNYQKAQEECSMLERSHPVNQYYPVYLALIQFKQRQNLQAFQSLGNILKNNSDNSFAYVGYSMIFNDTNELKYGDMSLSIGNKEIPQNQNLLKQKQKVIQQIKGREELFQVEIKIASQNKESPMKVCQILFEYNKYQDALNLCVNLAQENQEDFVLQKIVGISSFMIKNLPMSIDFLSRALKLQPNNGLILNNLAVIQIMNNDLEQAFQNLEKSIQLDPNHLNPHFNLAWVLFKLKKFQESIDVLQSYISFFPLDSQSFFLLGRNYEELQRIDEALQSFNQSIALDENNTDSLIHIAGIFYESNNPKYKIYLEKLLNKPQIYPNFLVGDIVFRVPISYQGDKKCFLQNFNYNEKQEQFYKEIIKIFYENNMLKESLLCSQQIQNSGNRNLFYQLYIAKNIFKIGDIKEAQKLVKQGLENFPNESELIMIQALIEQTTGDLKKAKESYKLVLEQEPKNIKAHNNLGLLYLSQEKFEKAYNQFDQGLQIDPSDSILLTNQAKVQLKKNNLQEAKNLLERSIKSNTEYTEAYVLLTELLYNEKNYLECLKRINEGLLLKPNPKLFDLKGDIFSDLNLIEKAIQSYSMSIQIDQTQYLVYYKLGILFQKINDLQNAMDNYFISVKIQPNFHQGRYAIASIQYMVGDIERANLELDNVIKLNDQFDPAYDLKGKIFEEMKQIDKAKEMYSKALELNPDMQEYKENLKHIENVVIEEKNQETQILEDQPVQTQNN